MKARSALLAAALVTVGLVAPAAHAATPVVGITSFEVGVPAHCSVSTTAPPSSFPLDTTITLRGTNPSSVTVGEAITVMIRDVVYPNLLPPPVSPPWVTVRLRADGPVTPNGDLPVGTWDFKAVTSGTATVSFMGLSVLWPRSMAGSVTLACLPTPGAATVVTTFTATTKPVCFGLPATIVGTTGNDRLRGTPGPDVIVGRSGDDVISGSDGDDVICGDHGNDRINANAGNDRVDGGYANDVVYGNAGDDLLLGGSGDDQLTGGYGADTVDGGIGTNICSGELVSYC